MGKLNKRVERIESQRKGRYDPNWLVTDACSHEVFKGFLEECPDLRLVELCDTDVMTYASIQVKIAYTDRNDKLLNQWSARSKKTRPPQMPGESDWDYVRRYARYDPVEEAAKEQRERDAVERARARLGKKPTGNAKSLDDLMRQDDEHPWERSYGTNCSGGQR